jgi:glutamate dehydrogenase/leucine dehydrogenase
MRKLLTLLAVGVLFSGLGFLRADEKGKTITIKGDGMCAKCALKEAKKCQNVVVVTKDDKKTVYYLAGKLSDEVHKSLGFCKASKDEPVKVEVTGTWEKKGGKLVLTPTEKIKKVE